MQIKTVTLDVRLSENTKRTIRWVLLPVAVLAGSIAVARATYSTAWVVSGGPLTASSLKGNLDDIQNRLVALEAKEHVQRATIGIDGAVAAQTGSWLLTPVNHAGTGNYAVSFAVGTFSAPPTCVASAYAGNQAAPAIECYNTSSPNSITCQATVGNTGVDTTWSLICVGL